MTLRLVQGNVRDASQACACQCGLSIPRDPEIVYVVDFGHAKPYPAYLREHSPDYGTYQGRARSAENTTTTPSFRPASDLPREPPKPPVALRPTIEVAHEETDATPSPESGKGWAFSQLVFNAGSFESVRAGFASYAREGETERDLRARVNSTVLADLEQQVMALRALHAKLRDQDAGESFGDIVARGRPKSEML